MRIIKFALIGLFFGWLAPLPLEAEQCGGVYKVRAGDTLSAIASQAYADARKWTVIYNTNIHVIGTSPHLIQIGDQFRIPCLQTEPVDDQRLPDAAGKQVKLLTAGDYQPFTSEDLINGGLITDIVNNAIKQAPGIDNYGIAWINDWSAHLDPLLAEHVYDLGFPWLQPDCEGNPDTYRCREFYFSNPMFEMLVLLFVDASRPFQFANDDDIIGKTLCRPAGYYTHDLEKNGRHWISRNKVTLKQPKTVDDCFDMLIAGEVDAVALNEFTGRSAIARLELVDRVKIVQSRPLSIEGLHVLVHKSHPQAEMLITSVNQGLDQIKRDGTYQNIVDQHLAAFWEKF